MFDNNKNLLLAAPSLANSSCWDAKFNWHTRLPDVDDIFKALFILILSFGIVFGNFIMICVLNSRRYTKYIDNQPRYLLTSLALNDLFIGLLIAPIALLPALYKCWPYGEIFCQIQALLRGALGQQSAVILVCMAIDRYIFLIYPDMYYTYSSKKGCLLIVSVTWIISMSIFAVIVLPKTGYYFNSTGLMACDVFHSRIAIRILSTCAYYFPTTMALMYCYGSAFHANKLRSKVDDCHMSRPNGSCLEREHEVSLVSVKKSALNDRTVTSSQHASTTRTMAAMSLGFIVMMTPLTIQQVVAACTGCKVPLALDFLVTWVALSDSFWNPFLYWLFNQHFRRISNEVIRYYICCKRSSNNKTNCCGTSSPINTCPNQYKTELEGEKYWGEILERTVSSSSLQALQKACHREDSQHWNGVIRCNSNKCRYKDARSDYRYGSAYQIDLCEPCLYKTEYERSVLSLDEANFKYIRSPDL